MPAKVIIFDFDGTIADSQATLLEITNRLSGEFGYPPVKPEQLWDLKNLSSRDIVKQTQISLVKIPFILRKIKTELNKEIQNLQPITGINEALVQLKHHGYQLGIITSNVKDNVVAFLQNHQLENLFDFIYAETTLFGKHRVINKFIKHHTLTTDTVIYVGDETRDIEAAQKSQVKVIAVSWGFNSVAALAQCKPDFLIAQPQELIEIVTKIN